MSTQITGPAWARGYDVAGLKALRSTFTTHDQGLPLGAFTAAKENHIAAWLAEGQFQHLDPEGDAEAYLVRRELSQHQTIRGWDGLPAVHIEAGDVSVTRMAWAEGQQEVVADALMALVEEADRAVLVEAWAEHEGEQRLLRHLGATRVGTKIRASSEIRSLHLLGEARLVLQPEPAEVLALGILDLPPVSEVGLEAMREQMQAAGLSWADHYSSYNARHAWSALGLTAYTPPSAPPDAQQIAKPAEMSRKWKEEHEGWEAWELRATPLWEALPACVAAIVGLPGAIEVHRVRLMRLTPGGGELTRHSDITDPDAGTRDGLFMRLHLPIITNPEVRFQQWLLDGSRVEMAMPEGRWCYIDTRKPHTARNGGEYDRVHLVADVAATEDLRRALIEGQQAARVEV